MSLSEKTKTILSPLPQETSGLTTKQLFGICRTLLRNIDWLSLSPL